MKEFNTGMERKRKREFKGKRSSGITLFFVRTTLFRARLLKICFKTNIPGQSDFNNAMEKQNEECEVFTHKQQSIAITVL
jgi:hypothetical protein